MYLLLTLALRTQEVYFAGQPWNERVPGPNPFNYIRVLELIYIIRNTNQLAQCYII